MTSAATTSQDVSVKYSTIDGVNVPPMAIGTWSWGDTRTWKYKEEDLSGVKEAWTACNKAGLTFYDTAEIYGEGKSESIIGTLRQELDESTRSKLYIATKYLPIPRPANWFLFSPGVVAACRKSLARLGVDKIDLYQTHANIGLHSIEAVARGLAECVKLGLVKSVGVSNYSRDELIRMSDELEKHGVKLASNQVEFSLLRSRALTSGLVDEMNKRNVRLLAYCPLGMGRLTGKYSSSNPPPSGRRFSSAYTWEQLDPLIAKLKDIAAAHGVTPSAVALNWVISHGAIPLGGARNAKQAEENAKALSFALTEDEVAQLTELSFEGKTSHWQHD